MKQSKKTLQINGATLTLETGILAQQATSAVVGRMGDTMVVTTVVMGKNDSTLGYFPLNVEYVERLYAGGRIKGSRWVKREGRPSDEAILTARMIDRTIRPLFPKELKKDVQVVVTVLSVDGENNPDILAAITTYAALAISKIPWNGPIGTTRIGLITQKDQEEEFIVNPTATEEDLLELDLIVSSKNGKVVMIEAGAKQVSEEQVSRGISLAREWNAKITNLIEEWVKEIGDKKVEVQKDEKLEEVIMLVEKSYKDRMVELIEKGVNSEVTGELDAIVEKIWGLEKENIEDKSKVAEAVDYIFKKAVREEIVNRKKRPDGRAIDQIRPISAQVGVLPRTHGSAIFSRGETQALSVATLGPSSMEQLIEGPEGEETKRYMHHYSFPPYSVGETGRLGSPSRREIGHGALAERALEPVIPDPIKFPYAIRVVSEIMSSNGSTSQAAVCGSTLSLMDAGVPLLAPVAGIAIGLMTRSSQGSSGQARSKSSTDDEYVVLTDIIGLEDFAGDMDFKVAGTEKGITAIQLDVKIDGLSDEIVSETLARAKKARLEVLEKMLSIIPQAREDVSKYAPKIKTVKIDPEKIGEVIGSGGKTIRNISATTGATVDVAEDGTVSISSISEEAVEKAANWVDLITRELHKGEVFEGIVKRIVSFGAFVEIVPGKEGLVHVSEMSTEYVRDPHDVLKIGQTVKVNVKEMDEHGRINLSMLFGERPERTREEGPARPPREERPRDDRREFQRRDDRAGSRRESGSRGGSRPFRRDSRRGGRAPFDSLRPDTRERR
ncbi:MAG: polyribonucleotide nucleotidyltransferase [Candidatus Levybacteria bacterium RIFCSPHIGHO2_02_FULL_39_36]|nr:MAG: Polyribonucleotide nucleotidyltransferase [Candidatus Levybacteria bacterium GW2011_GWA1_39_11]KKR26855.1 MAG: Polyribonucleotide nucleotidyltransferase [Microgenomates group bacterium GW2011_GWC1_39_7]KKR49575.1 MAG: Polyribonucleotide nucleotidyltransferase [Candidatus Levybacteria bacterium GW2011_GWA2_40_16]OGH15573.1 MAG: polyribonucleotide nucleotidyltransferase [Candidatus Levybacteria bacterium RIFCSPHIGHO2_01_FULL_38_96]OGH25535.1 MAG: polyribonucleotide nucleotidyltransferase 